MRLYLINPSNPLVSIVNVKESRWNRYRVWKPLSLMVLAGLTPSEWEISIVDENLGAPDYSAMPRPDLVGITAFTSQANRAYAVATHFRRLGVPVVMGGIHATMCREEAMERVDSVITGEAEGIWPQVLEDARHGSLRFLGAMDWREFVETMNAVEQTLRSDPGGVYGRMDFATRDRYRHVIAPDVYALPPHAGRGGWIWYTGSAGWMYRLILESLLGLRLEVDKLRFTPCLPADWEGFKMHYRYRETVYHIAVLQTPAGKGEMCVSVDGIEQPDKTIPLVTTMRNTGSRCGVRRARIRHSSPDRAFRWGAERISKRCCRDSTHPVPGR